MTDAGPLDLLVQLRDRDGGRHDYVELSARAVGYDVGDLTVRLAPLDDNVASKVFKWRTHADGSDPLPPLLIAGLEMARLGIPNRTRSRFNPTTITATARPYDSPVGRHQVPRPTGHPQSHTESDMALPLPCLAGA